VFKVYKKYRILFSLFIIVSVLFTAYSKNVDSSYATISDSVTPNVQAPIRSTDSMNGPLDYSFGFSKNLFQSPNKNIINQKHPDLYIEYINGIKYLDEIEAKIPQSITTAGMIETREKALYYWDIELNKVYALLEEKLLTDEIEELRTIQQKWINDRDEAINRFLSYSDNAAQIDYLDTLLSLTKQRTQELIYIYFNYDREQNFTTVPVKTYVSKSNDNDITYIVAVMDNHSKILQLFNETSNLPQMIHLDEEIVIDIDFMDVNLDGYSDIVVNTGGTVNETHSFYVWDSSANHFIKVEFEGFEMLSFFEVYEGYIKNYIKGRNPEDSTVEVLIWNGTTLTKEP